MTERLLKLVGPVHIVGGLVLFATGFIPAAQELLQSAIVVTDDFVWSPFFTAILGPTIASWGVLFGALVNQFYSQPAITLWRAMAVSVVIWAPLDTILCLAYGLYGGAIVNAVVFAALAFGLYSSRSLLE